MSDTTAFLSGCALTGIAAVLLLGGGLAVGQYRSGQPTQQLPSPPELPAVAVQPSPNATQNPDRQFQLERDLERQQTQGTELKTQVQELKGQIQELKSSLERQQSDTQRLTSQLQEQQRSLDRSTAQLASSASSIEQPGRFQILVLGAVGVTLLVVAVGGSIILIGIIVLLVQSRRQPRPMQIIHPIQPTYSFSNQEFLPPSARTRGPRQIDYYEN
jgi:hypothetical protein